jgi:hypothetical protein
VLTTIRPRLNHATVVAYLALFVALGGTSIAALRVGSKQIVNNSVRSKDLRNNDVRGKDIRRGTVKGSDVGNESLTGADLDESSLGTVPRAATATATGSATNAGALDGIDSTGFLRSTPPERFREVGSPGQPGFAAGWGNSLLAERNTAGFFKDPFGVVHLKGTVVRSSGGTTIFTLPAGYRPAKAPCFPTVNAGFDPAVAGVICVFATGEVRNTTADGTGSYLLDAIAFRAGPG